MTDNVRLFPGESPAGALPAHPMLKEAERESARHGFDRKLRDFWSRYRSDRLAVDPDALGGFIDGAMLMAMVRRHRGDTWADAFGAIVRRVNSRPASERWVAVETIMAEYLLFRHVMLAELIGPDDMRRSRLVDARSGAAVSETERLERVAQEFGFDVDKLPDWRRGDRWPG